MWTVQLSGINAQDDGDADQALVLPMPTLNAQRQFGTRAACDVGEDQQHRQADRPELRQRLRFASAHFRQREVRRHAADYQSARPHVERMQWLNVGGVESQLQRIHAQDQAPVLAQRMQ